MFLIRPTRYLPVFGVHRKTVFDFLFQETGPSRLMCRDVVTFLTSMSELSRLYHARLLPIR
jgi:hypothetical protein